MLRWTASSPFAGGRRGGGGNGDGWETTGGWGGRRPPCRLLRDTRIIIVSRILRVRLNTDDRRVVPALDKPDRGRYFGCMPNQDLPRRERLLAAAYAVLAERGYEAATVKEVARAAGVAPGLVHYYWRNKEELLTEVLQQASERYTREMQELARRVEPAKLAEAALTV